MFKQVFSYFFVCFCVVQLFSWSGLAYNPPTFITCDKNKGELCIDIRQCSIFDDLPNKNSNPPPFIGAKKILRVYVCALHEHNPYVCCKKPRSSTSTIEARIGKPSISKQLTKAINRHRNLKLLPKDVCGSVSTKARITGKKTAVGEYPWMALLVYDTDEGPTVSCGGTIINERYILAAAHCVNSKLGGVRLGEHNLNTEEDCDSQGNNCAPPVQDMLIEDLIEHPEYNSRTRGNDIALIRLATRANFEYSNVRPICLPMEETDLSGKSALVAGWGLTERGFNSLEKEKATLPILSTFMCQEKYKRFMNITSKQICAGGYEAKDSCIVDSGGPMMYIELFHGVPKFVQYGILSYSPRFCLLPGVYTRVDKYIEWILDNLNP